MRPRTTGRSSITALKSLYYIVHVLLGVFVNVLKYERRRHRKRSAREDKWKALLNVTTDSERRAHRC